jgi:hypothetical protein
MIAAGLMVCLSVAAVAQRGFGRRGGYGDPFQIYPNAPYDGRFTFVRVNYTTAPGGYWDRGLPAWAHGYPRAEHNLIQIMNEICYLRGHDEINTLALDDPELATPVASSAVGW